jgi:hypothetical protein
MNYLENVSFLSQREQKLWNMIRSKSGVVMAYGIPGISKSATFSSIAKKMNLEYIDFRTTTIDETDLGVFPTISEINGLKVVDHAVPAWAVKANKKPTLIHFEELNRCSSNIRNATLGILNERIIGTSFKFNEHVYMVASGNPVTDLDQDVEEFGTALRNRLIPVQFELTLKQWINEFAEKNVVPQIITFLNNKPDFFGNTLHQLEKLIGENQEQYPSPRSWTFLSDYIKAFPEDQKKDALLDTKMTKCFVGELASITLSSFLQEFYKINLKQVLTGEYDSNLLDHITIQRITEEFEETKKLKDLTKKEVVNWKKFISLMTDEIRASHINNLTSTKNDITLLKNLFSEYKDIIKIIIKKI